MSPDEVVAAFEESFGKKPYERYFDFDITSPIKSGSIGSVYLAKKPEIKNGREVLKKVVVKIGRQGLDREFMLGKMVLGVAILSSHYWAPHSKLAPFLEAMQQQADEFVTGFQKELDFILEAENQKRFAKRSKDGIFWKVPEVYTATPRIIEMEYIESAVSITNFLTKVPEKKRPECARNLAARLLYSLLSQIFVYQEFHGDLHPGNVLINISGEMVFIDWGNCVNLKGKWKPLWDYIAGAVSADVELLTTALINISVNPEYNQKRREEIRGALALTLKKKQVTPLTRKFFFQLHMEGVSGWHRRLQVVLHLMSNTQQLGLVVKSEYLHLSRSIAAAVGTYVQMYKGLSRLYMIADAVKTVTGFPLAIVMNRVAGRRSAVYIQRLYRLKLPVNSRLKEPVPKYLPPM